MSRLESRASTVAISKGLYPSHKPPESLKVFRPDSAETPAPVKITIRAIPFLRKISHSSAARICSKCPIDVK